MPKRARPSSPHESDDRSRLDLRTIEVCDSTTLDELTFFSFYEVARKPVMLTGLCDGWSAKHWTLASLIEICGDTKMDLAHGTTQYSLSMVGSEDAPYIYDGGFGEKAPELLKDFSVPSLFPWCCLEHLPGGLRPDFRWLLVGTPGAGFTIHCDPNFTCAWNTIVSGAKRWVMFPPEIPVALLKPDDGIYESEAGAAGWFTNVYPSLQSRAHELGMLEFVQRPLDTVFVPAGWWHVVLVLETSIGLNQNFLSAADFPSRCDMLYRQSPRAALLWWEGLPSNLRARVKLAQPGWNFPPISPVLPVEISADTSDSDCRYAIWCFVNA
jgi:hypothetical protein